MMEGLTLEKSVGHLKHQDQYKWVMEHLAGMREDAVRELDKCADPYGTMKTSGRITALTEVLDALMPEWDAPPP